MPLCTRCGATISAGNRFCMKCGAPVPATPPAQPGSGIACAKCAAAVPAGSKFCVVCGTPVAPAAPPPAAAAAFSFPPSPAGQAAPPFGFPESPAAPAPPPPAVAPAQGDLLSGSGAAEVLWVNSRPAEQYLAPDGTRYLRTPRSAADLPDGVQGLAYKAAFLIRGVEYVDIEGARVLAVVRPAPAPHFEPAPAMVGDDPLPAPAPLPPPPPAAVLPPPPEPAAAAPAPPAGPAGGASAELVQLGRELVQAFQRQFGSGPGSAARIEEAYARLDELKTQYEHYRTLGVEWMHAEPMVLQLQQCAGAPPETARGLLALGEGDYARLRHAMISSARLRESSGQ